MSMDQTQIYRIGRMITDLREELNKSRHEYITLTKAAEQTMTGEYGNTKKITFDGTTNIGGNRFLYKSGNYLKCKADCNVKINASTSLRYVSSGVAIYFYLYKGGTLIKMFANQGNDTEWCSCVLQTGALECKAGDYFRFLVLAYDGNYTILGGAYTELCGEAWEIAEKE